MMLATAASLGLVILCFRLPIHEAPSRVGWGLMRSEAIAVRMEPANEERPEPAAERPSGAPITTFGAAEDTRAGEEERAAEAEETPLPQPAQEEERALDKLRGRQLVVENPDTQPRIAGGPGAFYMNIQYPEEARRAGIEGRLVLDFVVEPDGQTSSIRVLKSLHPLCDSSATATLSRTRFVPGRQNGQTVRVRMRLPIRFELIDLGETATAEPRGAS